MAYYTFSTLGKDGCRYYPARGKSGPGLLDFNWTTDIDKAIRWFEQDDVETIAIEFCDVEIVELIGSGPYIYKIIKEMD